MQNIKIHGIIRNMKEITRKDLADATGFNNSTLTRWEKGESGAKKQKLYKFLWANREKLVKFMKN